MDNGLMDGWMGESKRKGRKEKVLLWKWKNTENNWVAASITLKGFI